MRGYTQGEDFRDQLIAASLKLKRDRHPGKGVFISAIN